MIVSYPSGPRDAVVGVINLMATYGHVQCQRLGDPRNSGENLLRKLSLALAIIPPAWVTATTVRGLFVKSLQ